MSKKIGLIGYSGHALVVADILIQLGFEIAGYFEKEPVKYNPLKITYLGFEQDNDFFLKIKSISLFVAIGNNHIRRKIMNNLLINNLKMITAISNNATVSPFAKIGQGTLVCCNSCINPFVKIKKGVIINTGAIIEHECIINSFSHIASGAVLAGSVQIGENSLIGANSVIRQGIKIGNNVTIGAGAVVLKNIPDNETWIGNPAKRFK